MVAPIQRSDITKMVSGSVIKGTRQGDGVFR